MSRRGGLAGAAAAAALLAGCGGGGDGRDAAQATPPERTPTAPAPTATPGAAETPAPSATPDRDARETGDPRVTASGRSRLERAGYEVVQSRIAGLRPVPRAALETTLGGGANLTILPYARAADARAKAAEFAPLAEQGGEFVALEVRGSTVFFALVEDEGDTLARAEFARAVALYSP